MAWAFVLIVQTIPPPMKTTSLAICNQNRRTYAAPDSSLSWTPIPLALALTLRARSGGRKDFSFNSQICRIVITSHQRARPGNDVGTCINLQQHLVIPVPFDAETLEDMRFAMH